MAAQYSLLAQCYCIAYLNPTRCDLSFYENVFPFSLHLFNASKPALSVPSLMGCFSTNPAHTDVSNSLKPL